MPVAEWYQHGGSKDPLPAGTMAPAATTRARTEWPQKIIPAVRILGTHSWYAF
jgi:hypothetical protein